MRLLLSLLLLLPVALAQQPSPSLTQGQQRTVGRLQKQLAEDPGLAPRLHFNLGQTYYAAGLADSARHYYQQALPKLPTDLQAAAQHQLALLALQRKEPRQAEELLRDALLKAPGNDTLRRNWELLARRLQQDPPPPPPPPKPQELPPPPRQRPPDEAKGTDANRPPLSPEQARAALVRIKKEEKQYLQQTRKSVMRRKDYSRDLPW